MMNKKDYVICVLLFTIGILLRAPFVEKMQSHWDGPQYSLAVIKYDLSQETPAPPGYPLYIGMAKLVYKVVNDPHKALLALSVIFSGAGAVIFYIAGRFMFGRAVGVTASLLFLTGSTFYFFGLTAYAYGITPVTTAVFALISYLIIFKNKKIGFLLGLVLSFALGIRPQEAFFLIPLLILSLYYLPLKQKILTIISFLFFSLLWFVPLINSTGGLNNYLKLSLNFAASGALPALSLTHISDVFIIIIKGVYLSFGIGFLFLLFYIFRAYQFIEKGEIKKVRKTKEIIFFGLWILPALVFNLFVRSDHAGHQMTYLSAFILLISYAVWKIKFKFIKPFLIIVIIVIFNLFTFIRDRDPDNKKPYVPTSFHYSEIRKNDIRLKERISFIKDHFTSEETLIVMSSDFWRPAMYYLPDYPMLELDGLTTKDPRFKSIKRDTRNWYFKQSLLGKHEIVIPANIKKVVLFDDGSYSWIVNLKSIVHDLKYSDSLISFDVKNGEKFFYDYKLIKKVM